MASLFGRRKKLILNEPDPEYEVVYLGNILTSMAKGDAEKPLALIWRTYCAKVRPDLRMTLVVCRAGLRARTDQQGLTEYWAHRITWCGAPERYPRLFCWIYKHEGKKMKPELRCHAALCKRADHPARIAAQLQSRIAQALSDYKREKLARQNWRLSASVAAAAAAGYQPPLPRRRLLLNTGGQNFRPPMARSKSAPRLQSINEEDDEQEAYPADPPFVALEPTPRPPHHRLSAGDFSRNRPPPNQFVAYYAQLSIDSQFEDENDIDFDCDSSNTVITCQPESTNGERPLVKWQPQSTNDSSALIACQPQSTSANRALPLATPTFVQSSHSDWSNKIPPQRAYSSPITRLAHCAVDTNHHTCKASAYRAVQSKFNGDVIDDVLLVDDGSRGRDEDAVSDESGYHEEDKSSSYNGSGDDVEIIVSL